MRWTDVHDIKGVCTEITVRNLVQWKNQETELAVAEHVIEFGR